MRPSIKLFAALIVLAAGVLTVFALASQPIRASGLWYVSPGGNDGNLCTSPGAACASINGALNKADFAPGDTIHVAVGTYTGTGDQVVLLEKSATLFGGWDTAFTSQSGMSTIDGQAARRGITVNSAVTATLDHFIIWNGSAGYGGGIDNHGTLTIAHSTINGNSSTEGGGIRNGDDYCADNIGSSGNLTIHDSTITSNTAGLGGGIRSVCGTMTIDSSRIRDNVGGSGISVASSILTLSNSTISGNSGTYGGGLATAVGTITVSTSSISGNSADFGGGISNGASLTLNNSTVTGNMADYGGGIRNDGGAPLTLNSTTVTGNLADTGGGLANFYVDNSVTLRNSLLAGNTAHGASPDCAQGIQSAGYNLVGNTAGCFFTATTGDVLNADPGLWPLPMGEPGYHPLLPGSPAIDAGNPTGCRDSLGNLLTTDQRQAARVGPCDIGAFEFDLAHNPLHHVRLPCITRACGPIFADDFSNPASGWGTGDNASFSTAYLNGEFRILVKQAMWLVYNWRDFGVNSYRVAVDTRPAGHILGSVGLVFGINYTGYYLFDISDGLFELWRRDAASQTWTALIQWTPSAAIHDGSETNRLEVIRNGASIKLFANGQLLAEVTDSSHMGYGVGLVASAYAANYDGRFDNFAIYAADCETTSASAIASSNPSQVKLEVAASDQPGR